MLSLEFHNPSGTTLATQAHAPRVDTLRGKRIGFLSIDEWQAYRTFPLLRNVLKEDFPDCELLPMDAFPRGIAPVGTEETAALVAASEVDAVIIGNAA